MDYYQVLGISFSDNTQTIKKHYYKLAKQYHPDKFSGDPKKCEEFKRLSEAYSTLSNPKKRYIYDIQRAASYFDVTLNLHLDDEDLELLYTYYQTICHSVEFRLFYNLFQSFPRQKFNSDLSQNTFPNDTIVILPKSIDCQNLQESFTIHLYRDLKDVYENKTKELLVTTQTGVYRLFVTYSDYILHLPNHIHTLTISIETKCDPHIMINGYDIHLTQTIDLYQYFFEPSTHIPFLSYHIPHDSRDLTPQCIHHHGLRNPITHKRGHLLLHTKLIYHMDMNIAQYHMNLLKTILSSHQT